MSEKILLDKYLSYIEGFGYEVEGFLLNEKELDNFIEKFEFLDILVLEVEKPDLKIKKIVQKIKGKFKNCKILILITEMNKEIENFIFQFSIDAYLTFPVLPFHLLRGLYCLSEF